HLRQAVRAGSGGRGVGARRCGGGAVLGGLGDPLARQRQQPPGQQSGGGTGADANETGRRPSNRALHDSPSIEWFVLLRCFLLASTTLPFGHPSNETVRVQLAAYCTCRLLHEPPPRAHPRRSTHGATGVTRGIS